ncbi:MAG: hydrogen gas-evolving membrane-bound hydrogenase subunit E [Bacteroidota bacterium]
MTTFIFLSILTVLAFIYLFEKKWFGKYGEYAFALALSGLFIFHLLPMHQSDGSINLPFVSGLDLYINISVDALGRMFVLLISLIGAIIFLYTKAYMKPYPDRRRLTFFLMIFTISMLGMVSTPNLLLLFVFWEITSVSSFILIGFEHKRQEARTAALQAMLITGFGGLLLLFGFLMIYQITGSFNLDAILADNGTQIKEHEWYPYILAFILAGAFTKSAQFPFHFWLPGAMQAPTPVSSFLHSATMVKAGIFVLAKLNPVMGGTDEWYYSISLIGSITMFIGAYLAIFQTDLKKILAFTTISALGTMVLLLGLDTDLSYKAFFVFLIVHAFYKAALFITVGVIDKNTGSRDITELSGLFKKLPVISVFAILSLWSMAGLPPMLGFIGKELIYEAKIQIPGILSYIIIFAVAANIFMVAVSLIIGIRLFGGRLKLPGEFKNKRYVAFGLGPVVLATGAIILGLIPSLLQSFMEPAIQLIRPEISYLKLKLWHGFNPVFLLSVFTVLMGGVVYLFHGRFIHAMRFLNKHLFKISFAENFNDFIKGFLGFALANTRFIQHGHNRKYLLVIFIFTSGLVWYQLYSTGGWVWSFNQENIYLHVTMLALVMIIATFFVVFTQSRLTAVVTMGVIGYCIALLFAFYGAVDLAITQIIVETIVLVLFVMVVKYLPIFARLSPTRNRIFDGIIALSVGGFITALIIKSGYLNLAKPISEYYLENSYSKGFGKNIVNVILVDFRALDTIGEITVLAVAAISILALLTHTVMLKENKNKQKL